MQRADVTSFEELYDSYSAAVFRYALRLCGNAAQAEDFASETFLRVWTAPDRLRIDTVRAYLFAIARNLYLQSLRHKPQQLPLDTDPTSYRAEADYEMRDEARRVIAALHTLPEVDRSALLLRAQEGMPYEEIAQVLNLTPAAVRVKVHRARVKLATICSLKEV